MESGQAHSAVLRRVVLHVKPDFYEWEAASRLHYRMHMPEDERFALERSVFRDLYDTDCPDHGKATESGIIRDRRPDAGGKEQTK